MTISKDKLYRFDEKLISINIKFIDLEEFNRFLTNIDCDRCGAHLKRYVVHLRIDDTHYSIGKTCYDSIKVLLSEIRGKALTFIREDLEEGYDQYLNKKFSQSELTSKSGKGSYKYNPDYKRFQELKWDNEHGNPPEFIKKEYRELKEKIRKLKAIDKGL